MIRLCKRIIAVMLAAVLCLAPAAQALTPEQLLDLLDRHYINTVPDEVRRGETVEEILALLGDPYTEYLDAEAFAEYLAAMNDTVTVGIGVSLSKCEQGLLVHGIYGDTPAMDVGLVEGDIITAVNGLPTAGESLEAATARLRGEEGTEVSFTVLHADGTVQDYTVIRKPMVSPTVTATMLEDGTTCYIYTKSFGTDTAKHFAESVSGNPDTTVWLIDMRGNTGGDVAEASESLGVFNGQGLNFYLRNAEDKYYVYATMQDALTDKPVILLVGAGTASSAEIFSLGIKDEQSGMLIGGNTFGKGVAQIILSGQNEPEALSEGDGLKITAYEYYGTAMSTANRIGVVPDLLVNEDNAADIAMLFSPAEPLDPTGWLRVHLGGWRWYVSLQEAKEHPAAFTEMLEALPPACPVFLGSSEGWDSTDAGRIAAAAELSGYTPRAFNDVQGLPCEKAANTLRTYSMLLGYKDGSFRPDRTLTRAQLCALLSQALTLGLPKESGGFSDVAENAWYADEVYAAAEAGYVTGLPDGTFDPEGIVTNEQLFAVMGRLASDLSACFYNSVKEIPEDTGVKSTYSDWARGWVWLLESSQTNILGLPISVLPGLSEDFEPQAAATRGDTAELLYNLLYSVSVLNY